MAYLEHDETESVNTEIGHSDATALVFVRAPIGHLDPRSPTYDCPVAGQLCTNAIKASIRSGRRVIDSENDEFRDPVLIEIEHRNISALVFPRGPVRDLMKV
jgi:hypothetical protein